MGGKIIASDKPDLSRILFWDFRYEDIEWREEYLTIIARVCERGSPAEWEEMIRFYSKPFVENALKHEVKFLENQAIEKVCNYFSVQKEDLLCYTRKQSRPGHWPY